MNDPVKAGIMSALIGMTGSFIVNYLIVPMPATELANGIGNAGSGLISGLTGALLVAKATRKTASAS